MREVVITGMGTTNPVGGDVKSTWGAVMDGRSGIQTLDNDWAEKYGIPVNFAGQLAVDPKPLLKPVEVRRMDLSAQYAVVAAREAWEDAGAPDVDPLRFAVSVASGIGGIQTILNGWDKMLAGGMRKLSPLTVPMLMPNSPAGNLSVLFNARAGARAAVSACASGAESIAMGADLIRLGRADIVMVGGTEAPIHPLPIASFARMRALSTRCDDPTGASRPFDVNRDGFVLGEGAAVLIIESEEHARARGARVYGKIAGAGITSDAYDIAPPDPSGQGQVRAMNEAIKEAGVQRADIKHVNGHATSTPAGDTVEATAIREALGEYADDAVVSATKSMTGHLLGGAGALETVLTVLALTNRKAPPIINLENVDSKVDLNLAAATPTDLPQGQIAAINSSFGFGGHNVALVVTSA